jgi:hypothetical protein
MFSETLLKRIRSKQKTYCETISKNGCKDIEDYRYRTGIIKGISIAISEAIDLHKSMYEETLIHSESEETLNEDSVI